LSGKIVKAVEYSRVLLSKQFHRLISMHWQELCIDIQKPPHNAKKNIIIYAGGLSYSTIFKLFMSIGSDG